MGVKSDYTDLFQRNRMTLIMSLPDNIPAWSRAAFEAGADAVKVHINLRHNASGNGFGRLAEYRESFRQMLAEAKGPMGIVPGNSTENTLLDADEIKQSGFSFFSAYGHDLPVSFLPCKQALMMACNSSYTPEEITDFEVCGADVLEASIIPSDEYDSKLCYRDLLKYRLVVSRTKLPVVVPSQRYISPDDVPYLADTGIRGIMIGAVVTGKDEAGIVNAVRAFRRAIDQL